MQFLYSTLSSNELKSAYILLPPTHLYTLTTPQRSIQPGYMLQGATGDQCNNSFLCVLPDSHLRLNELEHISGTNLAQGLLRPMFYDHPFVATCFCVCFPLELYGGVIIINTHDDYYKHDKLKYI